MTYRTQAHGYEVALATPHYLSGCFSLNSFLARKSTYHTAAVALFSSAFNLPHLCGLGGDAVILARSASGCHRAFNGMGITGSNQSLEYYAERGHGRIPARGLFSTMVYGAAYAIKEFMDSSGVNLQEVMDDLACDVDKPLSVSPYLQGFINKYMDDLRGSTDFKNWKETFLKGRRDQVRSETQCRKLVDTIRREGLETFYSGSIAERIINFADSEAPGLFLSEDFERFSAPQFDVSSIKFLGSTIHCHAGNAPWLEMAIMLGVIEKRIDDFSHFDATAMLRWCRLAGAVDSFVEQRGVDRCLVLSSEQLSVFVYEAVIAVELEIYSCSLIKPIWGKGADTVFMGVAHADGTLIGITSSIFTPFGAMLDPGDSGIILSNRALSFSDDRSCARRLQPRKMANHTINSLIVHSPDMDFTMGTTGGYVQVQILVQLLVRILYLQQTPQAALEAPRFANMGKSRRHQCTWMGYERGVSFSAPEYFSPLPVLCSRMGVAQVAGIFKRSGEVFAASDPRGEGVALAY